jgi:hypothetical protein
VPRRTFQRKGSAQHDYFAFRGCRKHFVMPVFCLVGNACCGDAPTTYCGTVCGDGEIRAMPLRLRGNTMINFTPISAAIGGALIGLAAVLLMRFNGRIAGISGIFAGLIDPAAEDRLWGATFVIGLIAAPLSALLLGWGIPSPQMPTSLTLVAVAGVFVGFGTRLSNGCTSGHGVCGIARLSPRSIAATAIFMAAAVIVVALMRHVIGA